MAKRCRRVLAALLAALLLAGCSGSTLGGSAESLLRAPQLSGQAGAVQRALSATVSGAVTFKYPASGDFLSPFLFGDWDGDGEQEAAALYTTADAGNAFLAVLEPDGDGWRVVQTVEGLSGEVESVTTAHLRDADSLQVLVGYGSAQGDRYMAVYVYADETLQTVLTQEYTDMLLTDITGNTDTQDLVLALPSEGENAGINLQLLTNTAEGFRNAQTLKIGEGFFTACTALHAGVRAGAPYLVVDGWSGATAGSLFSSFVAYNSETGFLNTYLPDGVTDAYTQTLRYDPALTSRDLDGNGSIDIPTEIADGGTVSETLALGLRFLLWQDFATAAGGITTFGLYDSDNRFFFSLPRTLRGKARVRPNVAGNGFQISGERGGTYCELRIVDPADTPPDERYRRVATVGGRQIQARVINEYPGLGLDDIPERIFLIQE